MQIIERKCEAQKGAGIRSNLNFYVVLWTVGKKTLDKLTDQPGILIPIDVAEVPDLSASRDNSDLAEDRPDHEDRFLCAIEERTRKRSEQSNLLLEGGVLHTRRQRRFARVRE
jgi:hypothetical protein